MFFMLRLEKEAVVSVAGHTITCSVPISSRGRICRFAGVPKTPFVSAAVAISFGRTVLQWNLPYGCEDILEKQPLKN